MGTIIITLGNSEIQFDQNNLGNFILIPHENYDYEISDGSISLKVRKNIRINQDAWYIPISSRDAGKYILDNYNFFQKILEYPLVEPLIDFISEKNIAHIVWVVTDQADVKHSKGDTLFYAEILQKYFISKLNSAISLKFSTIKITNNVKDIDWQYQNISKDLDRIILTNTKEDWNVYLFAQGGIDQINHALTLQLLQRYKEKVKIYQKAEDATLTKLNFPLYFLRDLNKQKILKHLEDYDFDKACETILDETRIRDICHYCAMRLDLQSDLASILTNNFGKKYNSILGEKLLSEMKIPWQNLDVNEKNKIKLTDLFYKIKISFLQKQYSSALIKIFTLFENLFKWLVENQIGVKKDSKINFKPDIAIGNVNPKWKVFLDSIDVTLYDYLEENSIYTNNPNRKAYFFIYKFLNKHNWPKNLDSLNVLVENLSGRRNGIAHNLSSISDSEFKTLFTNYGYTIDSFFNEIDDLIGTNGFGIYGEIRQKLLEYYE